MIGAGIGAGAVVRPFYNRSGPGGTPIPQDGLPHQLDQASSTVSPLSLSSGPIIAGAADSVFLLLSYNNAPNVDSVVVTFAGNPFLSSSIVSFNGAQNQGQIYWFPMNGTPLTGSVLVDFSGSTAPPNGAAMIVLGCSGLLQTSLLDRTKNGSGSSGSQTSGASAATTHAHDLILGLISTSGVYPTDTRGNWTAPNVAFTRYGNSQVDMKVSSYTVAVTGAQTVALTGASSRPYGAQMAAFKYSP